MVSAEAFILCTENVLGHLKGTQMPAIKRIAVKLAASIRAGGVVHLFGTGHSSVFAMEMCNRAGGLVPMQMMSVDELQRRGIRSVRDMDDPGIERDPMVAHELIDCYDIRPEDTAILVSNSGRNGAVVEMALLLKEKGLAVFCVTSMAHTSSVSSRHSSGRRLFEVADDVIDNCGPMGDALLQDDRLDAAVCSISSVTGTVIAQCLTAEITRNLLDWGEIAPVLRSSNLDNADQWNEQVRQRNGDRRG